jgi:hypothetical protein
LYVDAVFPEGFTRYKVYLNIKDNLAVRDNVKGVEAPLSAKTMDKTQLLKVLENVKLDKDDIKSILTNGKFSGLEKAEIANFMQVYSK